MDRAKYQHFDTFMGHYAQWVREGRSSAGLYPSGTIPSGASVKPAMRFSGRRLPRTAHDWEKARVRVLRGLQSNVHGTREQKGSRILMARFEPAFEKADRVLVCADDGVKEVVCICWLVKDMTHSRACMLLGLPSKELSDRKRGVFKLLEKSGVTC